MRGHQAPAKRQTPNDDQKAFSVLSRGRRTKLAKAAGTTLVKADQWARGDEVKSEVADGLLKGLKALTAKKK